MIHHFNTYKPLKATDTFVIVIIQLAFIRISKGQRSPICNYSVTFDLFNAEHMKHGY